MRTITRQKITLKKSSKHSRQLSELKIKFLEYYSKLPIQKLAAEFIGRSEDWVIDWKKKDTKFANQITSAKSAWALNTSSRVKSAEWLLERVMHDHFKEHIAEEHEIGLAEDVQRIMEFMKTLLPKQK